MEVSKVHDISVLHLFGELSLREYERIEKVLKSLNKAEHRKVLLDMAAVDHIHYRVVRHLVENAITLRESKGDLKLAALSGEAKEMIRFTGADQYLEDYATISEGILSFLSQGDGDDVSLQ